MNCLIQLSNHIYAHAFLMNNFIIVLSLDNIPQTKTNNFVRGKKLKFSLKIWGPKTCVCVVELNWKLVWAFPKLISTYCENYTSNRSRLRKLLFSIFIFFIEDIFNNFFLSHILIALFFSKKQKKRFWKKVEN